MSIQPHPSKIYLHSPPPTHKKCPLAFIMSHTHLQRICILRWLTIKELFAQDRRDTWRQIDFNRTWTNSHLHRKRTLNHLVKLSGCGFESLRSHIRRVKCVQIRTRKNPVFGHFSRSVYFITLFNISTCFHVIVLVFLYSCKHHSTSILELLETQIVKTRYWYQKCV